VLVSFAKEGVHWSFYRIFKILIYPCILTGTLEHFGGSLKVWGPYPRTIAAWLGSEKQGRAKNKFITFHKEVFKFYQAYKK